MSTPGNYPFDNKSVSVTYFSRRGRRVFKGRRPSGKFRSIFIVLVFEFIGNISYLSKYILWLKVVLLLVLSISFN